MALPNATSRLGSILALMLALLCHWAIAEMEYIYEHETCRLPINDHSRNYHLVRLGLDQIVCIRYGSVSSGDSSSRLVLPFACERNSDGTAQLVMRHDRVEACKASINAEPAAMGKACNILSSEYREDHERRQFLRLTGQDQTVADDKLDQVFVTDKTFICTERFGDEVVPSSQARRCDNGRLKIPNSNVDGLYTSTPKYDCSSMRLHLKL